LPNVYNDRDLKRNMGHLCRANRLREKGNPTN